MQITEIIQDAINFIDDLPALEDRTEEWRASVVNNLAAAWLQLGAENARVKELEAELAEARQGDNLKKLLDERQEVNQQLSQTIYSLRKEVGSLREELAEARRDTERLDWLEQTSAKKDLSLWAIVPNSDEPVWFVREENRNIDLGDGFSIREAIDAAIAREEER